MLHPCWMVSCLYLGNFFILWNRKQFSTLWASTDYSFFYSISLPAIVCGGLFSCTVVAYSGIFRYGWKVGSFGFGAAESLSTMDAEKISTHLTENASSVTLPRLLGNSPKPPARRKHQSKEVKSVVHKHKKWHPLCSSTDTMVVTTWSQDWQSINMQQIW